MEIALEPVIPTYSGGLGALAGDTIRSAADLKVPMVAVCLLHRRGYFYQRLDAYGNQQEEPVTWAIHDFLAELPERAAVDLEGRTIRLRAWRYEVRLPSCPQEPYPGSIRLLYHVAFKEVIRIAPNNVFIM